MKALTDTQVERWRYDTIEREPRVPRPLDWFSPGESIACKTFGIWAEGKIIEIQGHSPKSLMICLRLNGATCDSKECDSSCGDRYWALADFSGILGKKDLLRILADPKLFNPIDPRIGIVDYQKAEELFRLIEKLETIQEQA